MAYTKQEWTDGEVITKIKLDHIEEGIKNVETTPGAKGDKGDKGDTGATGTAGAKGDKGDKGDTGAAATIPKLLKIDAVATGGEVAVVITALNSLIADLKAKGYMTT